MSIGSTRKVNTSPSTTSRVDARSLYANNHSQFVENIDTTNNVSVNDESGRNHNQQQNRNPSRQPPTDFSSATPDISNSIGAMAVSGVFEDDDIMHNNNHKIGVYTNNQSIIKDEEVERTGRSYLKHFYEKNEHLIDVDELV
ncbi:MAG: hypothetical protein E7020_00320 [Alphaproteobacteria bacterium]|nr:hypothetical protein [Alphaproteobacteria bacterium]